VIAKEEAHAGLGLPRDALKKWHGKPTSSEGRSSQARRLRGQEAGAPDSVQMLEQRSALVLGLKSTHGREMHLTSLSISAIH
jgi:hypothetical protein